MPKVYILRLGHRRDRDKRITTHVGLTARALGAEGIILSGEEDKKAIESLQRVTDKWGGPFEVTYQKNWKKVIKEFEGRKVHLTMYGIPFEKLTSELSKTRKPMLIVIGGEKVPGEVYDLVDHNIAIGNQPHSEVTATALFLYEIKNRKLKKSFENGEIKIIPQEKGKKTK